MTKNIKKVAILGSGVMGSRIACHFANIGVQALLLDIVHPDHKESDDQGKRNKLVNDALKTAIKSNPSPVYSKKAKLLNLIETGNLEDDLHKIADCDWIMEVVIERLDIKQQVFENVEKHRKPGTIISSNTSGIPINMMLEGRSEDFQKHFLGTHFFNPPRYLKLLEIIPTPKTDPALVDFLMHYGQRYLGKTTVLCKDTPAFIANRIGVFSIMSLFHTVKEMNLTIEEVDKLTGPVLGRPKSATFRTCDVVGLDTLAKVATSVKENCPNDEKNELFELPGFIQKMLDNNWLGSKSGQGFYKKVKDEKGKSNILSLDLNTLEYREKQRAKFVTLEQTKPIDDLVERTKMLYHGKDKAGEFYQKTFHALFAYVTKRVPEISDEIYKIDDAMRAGFGWELGPFEAWDAIGLEKALAKMDEAGVEVNAWIKEMISNGHKSFYKIEDGVRKYYDQKTSSYVEVPGGPELNLTVLNQDNIVWQNKDATITDIGDGVLNVSFHSKMNTIGGGTLQAINKAIDLGESEDYRGVTIYNEGQNFSAGANVGLIFMFAVEQEWEELDFAIRSFQNTMMRVRYSACPVVVAPHNMALGGGCELSMHADKVIAHAETYMGLVEFGVGLIPGGGGTKEFALRLNDSIKEGDVAMNTFRDKFLTIGQAKVATSAQEAFELGYLREGIDEIEVSRDFQLSRAKEAVLEMHENGYTQPAERKDITIMGQQALGLVYVGANSYMAANYMSKHDQLISEKLGYVLAGGDISQPTDVSEKYLLGLERRAFLELCQEKKTLERIQSILTTGKVLRN